MPIVINGIPHAQCYQRHPSCPMLSTASLMPIVINGIPHAQCYQRHPSCPLLSTASLMPIVINGIPQAHCYERHPSCPLFALGSSFTLSIQVFVCLPRFRMPYRAAAGSLLSSILVTCTNHVSLIFLILSTIVSLCPSSSVSSHFGSCLSYFGPVFFVASTF